MLDLLHHCTIELFLTVVTLGTLIILITIFTYDKPN